MFLLFDRVLYGCMGGNRRPLYPFRSRACRSRSERPITSARARVAKDVDSIPASGPQHLGVRAATEVVGQSRIADVPRQDHAADAQGDEREGTFVRPRRV